MSKAIYIGEIIEDSGIVTAIDITDGPDTFITAKFDILNYYSGNAENEELDLENVECVSYWTHYSSDYYSKGKNNTDLLSTKKISLYRPIGLGEEVNIGDKITL